MSELRDARLLRALESAPDAHMQPDAKTRAAIRAAAVGAVTPAAAPAPWWRAAWESTGRRGPWNAAFATVLLASLVTVLWYDREVPDARTDSAPVASAPPPAPQPPAAPAAAAPAPAPLPPSPSPGKPLAARRQPQAAPATPKAVAPAPAEPGPNSADAAAMAERGTSQLQDRERRELAKAAPPPPPAETPAAAGAAAPAPVIPSAPPAAAAMTPAPAPAAAPAAAAPAPAPAAPAPVARAQSSPGFQHSPQAQQQLVESPVTVRLAAQGRVLDVPPERSRRLVELAQAAARSVQGGEPLAAPVTLRIELGLGASTGVLEVAGPQVRWNGLTGRPDAALLRSLEQEAARLLRR